MNTRWSWALVLCGLGCSKGGGDAVARDAATRAQANVREGLGAVGRLTSGLQAALASSAQPGVAIQLGIRWIASSLRSSQ